MADETEALRKRVEDLEQEVNDLRGAAWSHLPSPAGYSPLPAIERWKQPAEVTSGYTSQNVYDGVRPMAGNEAVGHVAKMRKQMEEHYRRGGGAIGWNGRLAAGQSFF